MNVTFFFSLQETLQKELNPTADPEMYSIEDLVNIRNGEMKNKLKYLVELCCRHTAECEVGFMLFSIENILKTILCCSCVQHVVFYVKYAIQMKYFSLGTCELFLGARNVKHVFILRVGRTISRVHDACELINEKKVELPPIVIIINQYLDIY